MATGSEILSYQGSGGLGYNADIPVSYGKPLEITNQTIRDIALRDFQKNTMLYQQRIKDRDKMLEMLDSGEIKVGNILDQDRPVVQKALDEQTQAFSDWMKKGVNDIDGALNYKKKTQYANQVTTKAQYRRAYNDKEDKVISEEKIPKFAEARKGHKEKNLSNFWGDDTPFQESMRLNIEPIIGFSKPQIIQLPEDKNKPYQKGTRTFFSYKDTLDKAGAYALTPEGAENLRQFHDTIISMPIPEIQDKLATMNKALFKYNQDRGITRNDPDFVTPDRIVTAVDANGKLRVVGIVDGLTGAAESLDKLAAKFSLAQHPQYQTDTFDIDKGKLDLFKAQTGRISAQAAATRAGAYARLQNKKLSQLTDAEKQIKGFWPRVTSKAKDGSSLGFKGDVVLASDLPSGYTNINGLDVNGRPIPLIPIGATEGARNLKTGYRDYTGGHFNVKYYDASGDEIDLRQQFKDRKSTKGTYEELREKLMNEGKLTMELVGQNGVGNYETALESARALSNKVGSGKEEPIYGDTDQQQLD